MTDPRIQTIQGRPVPLKGDDIDTDRIIPARFLRCVTFEGLGEQAFRDERYDEQGREKAHPFNDVRFTGAEILVVNRNFGCGSSREHAPQALARWGIKAILGESFADIFAGNCAAIGLPTATAPGDMIQQIQGFAEAEPELLVTLDIKMLQVRAERPRTGTEDHHRGGFHQPELVFVFPIVMNESHRQKFLAGTWDTLATLANNRNRIAAVTDSIPYLKGFAP
ncbi:3-isopropylmalate dehydratase small subunit 2 [Gracilinema caldarium]|uniref:3-isopropylmalate dehydratase small subunit n=1 Tax=Gracilinema caldarium TaxID=215591 RepID=UPI0026EF750C|nr:3-isopropylmalate dehydratase small subunit [Gracilinema caldarium]